MKDRRQKKGNGLPPTLRLTIHSDGSESEHFVENTVTIGRDENAEVYVDHPLVSRRHAELSFENGSWWLRDLQSRNGTFIDGQKIAEAPLAETTAFTLGRDGPEVVATFESAPAAPVLDRDVLSQYEDYYLRQSSDENAGERTIFIRQAFQDVQRRQRKRNVSLIALALTVVVILASFGLYQHSQANRQHQLAETLFYQMKSVELEAAKSETTILALKGSEGIEEVRRGRARRKELETDYDHFLKAVGLYSNQLSQQDQLILRVTRIFGECELGMPPNFVAEVKRYISQWRSTGKLQRAIGEAETKGYTRRIASELLAQDLPPQFFYLALQESSFDTYAIGPRTYKGIAKGMWQFIPETAVKFGLQLGPLYELNRPDPADDRHNFEKSTQAAARYLRFIYLTDAQASGLLVMASYNWGEGKVVPLIQSLPNNPRDRNFWRLLSTYRDKIPQETYDYVFYIVAAAVIGENPRLFGFEFENPLRHLERSPTI
jgi:pSer/pThr/pTyr-binding forkhead associated (FHA) protein